MIVGASAEIADALCHTALGKFPDITAEQLAHLKLTATAACIVAGTLAITACELPGNERVRLEMIVWNEVRVGDPRLLAAVDDGESAVDDVMLPQWANGKPMGDLLEGADHALADWLGENAFGEWPVSPRMVQFAKNAGSSMKESMVDFWNEERL